MLVRSWAGFVAPACCVCWACSHGVGCLSGSPCAIRVRSRLRCRRGRGSRMPPGVRCVRCVRLKPCTCTLVPCGYIAPCLHFDECSFVRGVFAFEVRETERSEHRAVERRQPQRWAVRAAEGLDSPCPRPWVPTTTLGPSSRSIAPKRSRAMVRRILSTPHRPDRQGAEEETHGKAHLRASARPRTDL